MLRRSNCTLAASASSRHGSSSGLRRSSPTLETTGRCVCVWRLATREMRDERDIYVYLHPLEPQPRNLCSAILSSVSQLNSSALVNTYTQWSPPISPISTLVYTYTHFSPPISQLYLPGVSTLFINPMYHPMCIINSPQATAELAKLGAEERQLRSHVERIELRISRSQIWGGGTGGVGGGLVAQSRRSIVRTVQLFKPTALMRVGIGLATGRDEPGRDEPTSETTRGGRESRGRVAHAPCPPPIIKAIEPMSIADCAALSVGDQLIGINPPPPPPH